MSDWQVGDLAVCVDEGLARYLRNGRVYLVIGVTPPERWDTGETDCGLVLEGMQAVTGFGLLPGEFPATRFRKIRPDEHEACEEEFVTLLKRTKVRA